MQALAYAADVAQQRLEARCISIAAVLDSGASEKPYLQWVFWDALPPKSIGRIVLIQGDEVKHTQAAQKTDFSEPLANGKLKLLVPNTGAQMVRAAPDHGSRLSKDLQVLQEFVRLLFDQIDDVYQTCAACGKTLAITTCPVCRLSWHEDWNSQLPPDFARRSHIDNVSDGGLRDSSLANALFDAVAKVSAQDADRSVWLAQLHNNYVSLGNGMVFWDRITNHACKLCCTLVALKDETSEGGHEGL